MDKFFLKGKRVERTLNNHIVTVIVPRRRISYEEGIKRIDRILAQAKKEAAEKQAAKRTAS